jgi:hypothetical protein
MRRIRVSLAAVAALILAATMGATVLGQDENRRGHPVLGSWNVDATPTVAGDPPELISFHLEGSVRGAGPGGASVGTWEPTGGRSADVTFLVNAVDPTTGRFVGLATIRGSLRVSADGESFSGTYTFEPPAAFAEAMGLPVGQLGPSDVTGERIAVEPMGETVGPIPAFPQPGPGTADGSPAPGASPIVLEVPAPSGALPVPDASLAA